MLKLLASLSFIVGVILSVLVVAMENHALIGTRSVTYAFSRQADNYLICTSSFLEKNIDLTQSILIVIQDFRRGDFAGCKHMVCASATAPAIVAAKKAEKKSIKKNKSADHVSKPSKKLMFLDDKSATESLPPLHTSVSPSLPALLLRRTATAPPTSTMNDYYNSMNHNGSSFGAPDRMMHDTTPIPRTISNNSTTDQSDAMAARFLDQIMLNRRAELEQDIERQLQVRMFEMQYEQQEAKRQAIIRLILSIENQNISGL